MGASVEQATYDKPVDGGDAGPGCGRVGPVAWALILIVRLYQATLRPVLGGQCRYQPSCSQYMVASIRKYGAWPGVWRGLRRVGRCHPWGGCGYDPP